jgi:hypothetical protein
MKERQTKHSAAISSGLYSSLGLLPHLVFLIVLFFGKMLAPLGFLIITYIATTLLGEYLFCKRIDQNTSFLDWLKRALHPKGYYLFAYIAEFLIDGLFLFMAIKFNWLPLNFFLILLGCKFLSAPVQVYLSYIYLSKNAGFTLAVCSQALFLFVIINAPEMFLYALILKGALSNGIAVARSQYAEEVLSKTEKDFHI